MSYKTQYTLKRPAAPGQRISTALPSLNHSPYPFAPQSGRQDLIHKWDKQLQMLSASRQLLTVYPSLSIMPPPVAPTPQVR